MGNRSRRTCTKGVNYSEAFMSSKYEEEGDTDVPSASSREDDEEGSDGEADEEPSVVKEEKSPSDFKQYAFNCGNASTTGQKQSTRGKNMKQSSIRDQLENALKHGKPQRKKNSKDKSEDIVVVDKIDTSKSTGRRTRQQLGNLKRSRSEEKVPANKQPRTRGNIAISTRVSKARKEAAKLRDETRDDASSEDSDFDAESSESEEVMEEEPARKATRAKTGAPSASDRLKALAEMKKRRKAKYNENSDGSDQEYKSESDAGEEEDEGEGEDEEEGGEGESSGSEDESSEEEEEEEAPADQRKTAAALRKRLEKAQQILNHRKSGGNTEYLIKFRDKSYRDLTWVPMGVLKKVRTSLWRAYHQRYDKGTAPTQVSGHPDGVNPQWTTIERVFAAKSGSGKGGPGTKYLVKWEILGYAECTWEAHEDLQSEEDLAHVAAFWRREERASLGPPASPQTLVSMLESDNAVPEFQNGFKLRDYQIASFKWMVSHAMKGSSCILGDEMGLGKTAQSIAVMEFLRVKARVRDPMLVVAPLTTLGHWRREIESWTNMNVVCYMGGREDREVIDEYELYQHVEGAGKKSRRGGCGAAKFDIIVTSFEILRDTRLFESFAWSIVVVDEAHRLKSLKSAVRQSIQHLRFNFLLLLTGTPIQNNMSELFSILNLVDKAKFPDLSGFLERFGDPVPTPEQLQDLKEELRPLLLRRMKEDVETLPDKEEVIIWVELTSMQREYYKALYEKNIGALLTGAKPSALPGMRNLAMDLQLVQFLCNGVEDDLVKRLAVATGKKPSRQQSLEAASGKLLLVGKLLRKLRSENRRVLIFSQFKIMLDLMEEFVDEHLGFPFERLDGDTKGEMLGYD